MKKFLKVLFLLLLVFVAAGVTAGLVRNRTADKTCKHELESSATVAPTCTTDGHTGDITCKICGEKLLDGDNLPALGHSPEEIPAVAPTCTQTGLTAGSKCTRCGEILIAQEAVPALGHSPEDLPAVAATCTQDGFTAGSACSRCGEILTAQETVPSLGHVSEIVLEGHAATCTEEGVTDILKCSRCNVLLSEQEQIPALGHELAELPAVAATCTQAGLSAGSHCERCDDNVVPQETVPALGHTFGEWTTTSPKCYEEKIRKCEVCEEQERKYIQKQDHVQAQNGYHCEHCGKMLITVNGTEITGCDSALEELTVYYDADGIIIRSIAPYAFAEKNLRDVKIKTYLEYVGEYAFFGCYEDLRIALYTDYGANTDMERWAFEWYYGNGDFESPFYYYTTTEPVTKASEENE